MEYYIITKIHFVNNEMVWTEIGYLTDKIMKDDFHNKHSVLWETFISNNLEDLKNNNISAILDKYDYEPVFYSAGLVTKNIEGLNLPKIVDTNTL